MVNQQSLINTIEQKGKNAVIHNIVKGFKNYTLVIRRDLIEQNEEELSRFNGILPPILLVGQDVDYLKKKEIFEQCNKELKEQRDIFKNLDANQKMDYRFETFAKWIVENPRYSYLFDYRKNYPEKKIVLNKKNREILQIAKNKSALLDDGSIRKIKPEVENFEKFLKKIEE